MDQTQLLKVRVLNILCILTVALFSVLFPALLLLSMQILVSVVNLNNFAIFTKTISSALGTLVNVPHFGLFAVKLRGKDFIVDTSKIQMNPCNFEVPDFCIEPYVRSYSDISREVENHDRVLEFAVWNITDRTKGSYARTVLIMFFQDMLG